MNHLINQSFAYKALMHEAEMHMLPAAKEAYTRAANIICSLPFVALSGCTNNFWCAEMDCNSYSSGEKCDSCFKYGKCRFCVVQSAIDKPFGCSDLAQDILSGFPEDSENG